MKVTIEIDCTPKEARAFLGQPDMEAFNAWAMDKLRERFEQNAEALKPEELMKGWMTFGGQAQEQFMRFMEGAASAAAKPAPKG